jgi:hypothetical protein
VREGAGSVRREGDGQWKGAMGSDLSI